MDIAQSMVLNNIQRGYKFEVHDDRITLTETLARDTLSEDIEFEFNKEENSIYIGIKGQENPFVCGVIYYPIQSCIYDYKSPTITVKLVTESKQFWPSLISKPSSRGIDTKSLFVLVLSEGDRNLLEGRNEAIKSLDTLAYDRKYPPAIGYLAFLKSCPNNSYGIEVDLPAAIELYSQLYKITLDPGVVNDWAILLVKENRLDEARKILEENVNESNEIKFHLACLLSPLYGKFNEPEKSVKLFRELSKYSVKAARKLAVHLEKGIGCKADKKEANRIRQMIKKVQPKTPYKRTLQEQVQGYEYLDDDWETEDEGEWGVFMLAACVGLGVALATAAYTMYHFIRKKKQ